MLLRTILTVLVLSTPLLAEDLALPGGYSCRVVEGDAILGVKGRDNRFRAINLQKETKRLQSQIRAAQKARKSAAQRRKLSKLKAQLAALKLAASQCKVTPSNDSPPNDSIPPIEEQYSIDGDSVSGRIYGDIPQSAIAVFGSDLTVRTAPVVQGRFSFSGIAAGTYFLRVDAAGYDLGASKSITFTGNPGTREIPFLGQHLSSGGFRYHWQNDQVSRGGYEYSAFSGPSPVPTFLGEEVPSTDSGATTNLSERFKAVLSNEGVPWDRERAERLLQTFETLPLDRNALKQSKWVLRTEELPQDIVIRPVGEGVSVELNEKVFDYATPKIVELEGLRGTYFSKRLHRAVVRYVTNHGENQPACEKIMQDRFGVSFNIPDYRALTAYVTNEGPEFFQQFRPEERISLISMFEEMPEGYHKLPSLRYLVRRKDGMVNPLNAGAPAIAWVYNGYIEFMDFGIGHIDIDYVHRLILHEKAHFLWHNVYSEQVKNDWITLGEWYRDPNNSLRWLTNQTTQFVSAYGHATNPDEDMAESMSYYILNPRWLETRAPAKFEFIRSRIMHGDRYFNRIREDLTFQVYNLSPDYVYPGRIKRVDITVDGAPDADKIVTVEIELFSQAGFYEGARYAFMRLFPSDGKTYRDLWLNAANPDSNGVGTVLRGSFTLSKFAKSGYWTPGSIDIYDQVGNARYQGRNTFGWRMYVANPLEDTEAPIYVPDSLQLEVDAMTFENQPVHRVHAWWRYEENKEVAYPYAVLVNADSIQGAMGSYGTVDVATKTAHVWFWVSRFRASGDYGVSLITMADTAGNFGGYQFGLPQPPGEEARRIVPIVNPEEEFEKPELDLNRISVSAEPTNPAAPNGETLVRVEFYVRDNASGVGAAAYRLLDPMGGSHFNWFYHENTYTFHFQGDPTAWKRYEIIHLLPVGSAPGLWGLQVLEFEDKAGNRAVHDFKEVIRFAVDN